MSDVTDILTIDPAVEDRIQKIPQDIHDSIVRERNYNAGKKNGINRDGLAGIKNLLSPYPSQRALGGTAKTALGTLKGLAPDDVSIRFITAVGDTDEHRWVHDAFRDAKIDLLTHVVRSNIAPEIATTCMLIPPSGQRTIITHGGNINEIVTPALLEDERISIQDYGVVHLLGTNREETRLGSKFVDLLLIRRWQHEKDLWLNLPTHEDFAKANGEYFRMIIPSANVVLGNMEELRWTFGAGEDSVAAIYALQAAFASRDRALVHRMEKNGREQVGFITDDKRPAFIVTANRIEQVYTRMVPDREIVNTGGAGDTAFGGFLAGYVRGMSFCEAAEIGMILAARKLRILRPSLDDPQRTLGESAPIVARNLAAERQQARASAQLRI